MCRRRPLLLLIAMSLFGACDLAHDKHPAAQALDDAISIATKKRPVGCQPPQLDLLGDPQDRRPCLASRAVFATKDEGACGIEATYEGGTRGTYWVPDDRGPFVILRSTDKLSCSDLGGKIVQGPSRVAGCQKSGWIFTTYYAPTVGSVVEGTDLAYRAACLERRRARPAHLTKAQRETLERNLAEVARAADGTKKGDSAPRSGPAESSTTQTPADAGR